MSHSPREYIRHKYGLHLVLRSGRRTSRMNRSGEAVRGLTGVAFDPTVRLSFLKRAVKLHVRGTCEVQQFCIHIDYGLSARH